MVAGGVTNLTGTVLTGTALSAPETITTVGTTVKDKAVDVGKRGFSVGDSFFTTVDIKSQAGVDLGTERTQCTLGAGRWAICTGTFDITGRGEIVGTAVCGAMGSSSFAVAGSDAIARLPRSMPTAPPRASGPPRSRSATRRRRGSLGSPQ
jgi:hypothetical protein